MQATMFTMMGYPGSGKTYFGKRLAAKLKLVRLNATSLRKNLPWETKEPYSTDGYQLLFGAMDYATAEILQAGYSVIYDAKDNELVVRQKNAKLAADNGARHITIWMQLSLADSLARAARRETAVDQNAFDVERVKLHSQDTLEAPTADEAHIIIDGKATFDQQYQSFIEQMRDLAV